MATPITIATFEEAVIPTAEWTHRAHLTVACLLLRAHALPEAIERVRAGLHRCLAVHNITSTPTSGYHETITVAWMRVLHAVMQAHGAGESAEAFLDEHPYLLQRTLLRLYYTRARLMSEQARRAWVEPDLAPLPSLASAKDHC